MSTGSGGSARHGKTAGADLARRVGSLERALQNIGEEVRTTRLVIVDGDENQRIVAEIADDVAELRLQLPPRTPEGNTGASTAMVVFAAPNGLGRLEDRAAAGRSLGVQLWVEGNAVLEVDVSEVGEGQWRPHIHLGSDY